MKIKDLQSGRVFEYGGCHDSLHISGDGKILTYYNLQNGDGSRYGDYRFVMDDGEVPFCSQSPDAIHGQCYFNIGGFPDAEKLLKDIISELESIVNNTDYNDSIKVMKLRKWIEERM